MFCLRFFDEKFMAHYEVFPDFREGGEHGGVVPKWGGLTGSIRLFQGRAGLAELAKTWEMITDAMPGKECFHEFAWYRCYLDALLEDPGQALFFVVYQDGNAAAIFPFVKLTQRNALICNRILGLPTHPHLPFGDFVIAPDADPCTCLGILLDALGHQKDFAWDSISLPRVFESNLAAAVKGSLLGERMILMAHPSEPCDYVPVKPYDELFKGLSSGARSNLRRARKRAAELEGLQYSCITTSPDLEAAFEVFLDLESAGWKGENGSRTAIKLDRRLVKFYRSLLDSFSSHGGCVIHLLVDGERPICAAFGLVVNGTYYGIKIGYDEEFKQLSPGVLLHEFILKEYAESGQVECLNLVSHTAWQRCWRPIQSQSSDIWLFRRTMRGRVLSTIQRLRNAIRALKLKCRKKWFVNGRRKSNRRRTASTVTRNWGMAKSSR